MIPERWQRVVRTVLLLAGVAVMLQTWGAVSASADDAGRIRELERRLEENSRLIEKLSERLHELEDKAAGERHDAAPVTAVSPAQPESAPRMATPGSGELTFLDEVTWLHGFADVG